MRKILSVILTVVLLLTSVSVLFMFNASAENTAVESITEYSAASPFTTTEANRLGGTPYYYAANSKTGVYKEKCDANSASSTFLYDGNFAHNFNGRSGYRYYNGLVKDTETSAKAATDTKIVLELSSLYTADAFFIAGSTNQYPITAFEIYTGNDLATLFNVSNLTVSYERVDSAASSYYIDLKEKMSFAYFGLRILKVDSSVVHSPADTGSIYLNEIAVYGDSSASQESLTQLAGNGINYGGLPVQIVDGKGAVRADPTVSSATSGSLKIWTDGKLHDASTMYNYRMWNGPGMTIAYDLKAEYDVSSVVLSSGHAGRTDTHFVKEWKVYVGNDLTNLYSEANCYGYVLNESGSGNVIDKAILAAGAKGRYVGVKLVDNSSTANTNSYIHEISIFGSSAYATETDINFTKDSKLPGQNVLAKDASVKTWAKQGIKDTLADRTTSGGHSSSGAVNVMFNQSFANTELRFVNTTSVTNDEFFNMQIVFETSAEYTVGSVLVHSHNTTGTNMSRVSYIAYVGTDRTTLFKPENILAVCLNDRKSNSTYTFVDKDSYKTGDVFGILILGAWDASGNPVQKTTFWPDEIGFFEPVSTDYETVTSVSGKPINAGKTFYQGTSVKTADAYSQNVALLTNGGFNDSNVADNRGKGLRFYNGATTNLSYDLGAKVDIAKVLIAGGMANVETNTMALKSYGVFVADTQADLFKSENQVAFFWNPDNSQVHLFDLSALKLKGQFVGIQMYDIYAHIRTSSGADAADTSMYITEFNVYGNWNTDAYTITNEPSDAQLSGRGSNAIAGATLSGVTVDNALLADGTVYNAAEDKTVTLENADGAKFTYDLGSNQRINSFLVGSAYDLAVNKAPLHFKVYVSNSEATLWDSPVIEYYSVNYKKDSATYSGSAQLFELANEMNGRYVGFEFVSAALGSSTLTLTELAVYSVFEMELTGTITTPEKIVIDGVNSGNSLELPSSVLSGIHTVVVWDNAGNNEVYFAKNGVFTIKPALANAFEAKGAQIRTEDPLGLRFVTAVTLAAKQSAFKIGTVAAKSAALNGKALVLGSKDYKTADALAYEKDVTDIKYSDDTADSAFFSIALYNLGQHKYLTRYAARPYIIVKEGNDEYVIYGSTVEARPVDIATEAKNDTNANYSEAVMNYVNGIVDGSDITEVSDAYAETIGLNDELLAAAVKATGNQARLKKVIEKAQRGEDIVLGTLGGSITQGYSANPRDEKCYSGLLREWLQNTFGVNVTLVNAGIGSTTSVIGVHRIVADLLSHNPDLVILEYAVNETESDRTNATYEACVRRILSNANAPALMLLFTVKQDGSNNQEAQMLIGNNYQLPMISYKDGVYPLIADETLIWADISPDTIHPNNYGHQMMTCLITDFLSDVIKNVANITDTDPALAEPVHSDSLIYMNATLYTSETLPDEWVESFGSFKIVHDTYYQFPNGWRAEYDGKNEPMVINVPAGKAVTFLMHRTTTAKEDFVGAVAKIEAGGTVVKNQNLMKYLTATYADAITAYTNTTSQTIKITITPQLSSAEGETSIDILGIMIAH